MDGRWMSLIEIVIGMRLRCLERLLDEVGTGKEEMK